MLRESWTPRTVPLPFPPCRGAHPAAWLRRRSGGLGDEPRPATRPTKRSATRRVPQGGGGGGGSCECMHRRSAGKPRGPACGSARPLPSPHAPLSCPHDATGWAGCGQLHARLVVCHPRPGARAGCRAAALRQVPRAAGAGPAGGGGADSAQRAAPSGQRSRRSRSRRSLLRAPHGAAGCV